MVTAAIRRPHPLAPDTYERLLAIGCTVMLAFLAAALFRGRADWHAIHAAVWLHLATIAVALGLSPVLLLRPRGTASHRAIGWTWTVAMIGTAAISLFIRDANGGGFSVIHILSAAVLILVPRMVWNARRHRVAAHRRSVRAIVTGALLIAGFFTFPFDRLLGHWLFAP